MVSFLRLKSFSWQLCSGTADFARTVTGADGFTAGAEIYAVLFFDPLSAETAVFFVKDHAVYVADVSGGSDRGGSEGEEQREGESFLHSGSARLIFSASGFP